MENFIQNAELSNVCQYRSVIMIDRNRNFNVNILHLLLVAVCFLEECVSK